MEKVWLFLAFAAVAVAATETQPALAGQEQDLRRRCPRYGCYSTFGHEVHQDRETLGEDFSLEMAMKDIQFPLPEERTKFLELPTDSPSGPSKLAHFLATWRSKREEQRAGPVRPRGRQRSGSRRVCRGCYSGLMIVAPPVDTSNNTLGALIVSHSESGADSSGEY